MLDSSTWVGCLESSWCKWFAGLCCGPEAGASALKLVYSSAAAAVGQSIAAVGLGSTKLVIVGVAGTAAGWWYSTSKLGYCALSSSRCRTTVLFLEAVASPCLCWLEAGEGKLPLFLWLVCLFLFLSLLFLFLFLCLLCQASACSKGLASCLSLCSFLSACLSKLCPIHCSSLIHSAHRCC